MEKTNGWVPKFLKKSRFNPGDWLILTKAQLRVLMRPGWDMAVRIYACLIELSAGYQGELAVQQVRKVANGDPPNFVAITPAAVSARLLKVAVEEFRNSGKELSADERQRLKIRGHHIRRAIANLEAHDGGLTSVTAVKFLARDTSTQKQGWADVKRIIKEHLSFDEARAQKLIVPIRELPARDRQRLNGKSFIFVHTRPRPATVAALMRRRDEDDVLSKTQHQIHQELTAAAQRVFQFIRAEGIDDPRFADELARVPTIVSAIEQLTQIEIAIANERSKRLQLQAELKQQLRPIIEAHKRGEPLPPVMPVASQAALFPPVLVVDNTRPPAAEAATGLETPGNRDLIRDSGDEMRVVLTAMREFCAADVDAAVQMVAACRSTAPQCTTADIVSAVKLKGEGARNKRSPVKYLSTSVCKLFVGPVPFAAATAEPAATSADFWKRRAAAK